MRDILLELVTAKFLFVYAYFGCILYVHFRGKERLRFGRQVLEHSGILAPYNVLMYAFSAVPNTPLLNARDFPELDRLRDNWEIIRDEALALNDAGRIEYTDKQIDLTFMSFRKRGWKRFHLKWYDDYLPSARALCPRTVELISSVPSINAAAFTMLPPGTELGKHRDPLAGSLRYHLGLVTPNSDDCSLWVDGDRYSWRDGEDVVFDETYIHWAANKTDQTRIILFCDMTRPLHTRFVRGISNFMNKRVFKITGSRNEETETSGLLNRATPMIFAAKTFFANIKERNRQLYYAGKYTLGGLLAAAILYAAFR
ncbi:MAG: beta-hydroxylase [Hyphomicrobiaceae bacterium]